MRDSRLEIRVPRPEDYAQIAKLAGQLGYPSTRAEIARRVTGFERSRDHAVFVAEMNHEVVGWIGVFVYRCIEMEVRAEINGFIVDERVRSQGIGPELLQRAEEWARERGCTAMGVKSNVIREGAHRFYERSGYKHVKTQKSFRKDL